MRVILKAGLLALAAEDAEDRAAFAAWREASAGHVFHFDGGAEEGGAFVDLGPREEACREPINVYFGSEPSPWRAISNLAHTPFLFHGRHYASVEGFWQGLKRPDEESRARIAALWGGEARKAGTKTREPTFAYEGRTFFFGGADHHDLMREACRAKFTQSAAARAALLASGERPLAHRVRRDSRTIPGALLADIWMRLRAELREVAEREAAEGTERAKASLIE